MQLYTVKLHYLMWNHLGFQTLDLERCNFEYLFAMKISIDNRLDILNRVSCNIFDTLFLLMTSEAHVQQLIAIAKSHEWNTVAVLNRIEFDRISSISPEYTDAVWCTVCSETTQQETTNFTVQLSIRWPWSMFSRAPECSKQLPRRKLTACWRGLGASYPC